MVEMTSADSELFVLRACYSNPQLLDADGVSESFSLKAHREVYAAMRRLADRGVTPDLVALRAEVPDVPITVISQLSEGAPVGNYGYHLDQVRGLAQRRAILRTLEALGETARDASVSPADALDSAMGALAQIEARGRPDATVQSGEAVVAALQQIRARQDGAPGSIGVPSGIPILDGALDGFRPGGLYLVGARTSVGKTAFALQVARHAAVAHGLPVGVVSLEMTVADLQHRLLSAESGIQLSWIQRGALAPSQWTQLTEAGKRLAGAPLTYFTRRNATVGDIRAWARQQKRKGMRLLVIDYVGLIRHPDPRLPLYQQVTQISAGLKSLALELEIPVMALVQLNRAAEGVRPTLAHLRDSGSLEQDADVVMFLYRPGQEEGDLARVELDVAKHRAGPLLRVPLLFRGATMQFFPEVAG